MQKLQEKAEALLCYDAYIFIQRLGEYEITGYGSNCLCILTPSLTTAEDRIRISL